MRGETERQSTLMLGLTPEGFVPRDHPLRRIKPLVDSALRRMSLVFDEVYATRRTALDPARASAQSESVDGLLHDPLGAPVLRATALQHPLQVVPRPQRRGRTLPSDDVHGEPRTVDAGGPPVQARCRLRRGCCSRRWCARRNRDRDFRGERHSRETHVSTTDPEARL